jgi:chromatin modification-related protein VID21
VLPSSRVAPPITEEEEAAHVSHSAPSPPPKDRSEALVMQGVRVTDAVVTEDLTADPRAIEPPTIEDESAAAPQSPAANVKPRDSQVVHLPPKHVQEAKLYETEQKLDKAADKQRKEDEKLGVPHTNMATDLVSSPSSTVGAYSQATPHAPHHSPDTSPESEHYPEHINAQGSTDDALDPAAQQVKEDHERSLRAQMKQARELAREMSSPTPEVEKQIEDEQAIRLARDGKRELGGPKPGLVQQAEEVVRETTFENQEYAEAAIPTADDPAADSLPTPTTIAPEPSTLDLKII